MWAYECMRCGTHHRCECKSCTSRAEKEGKTADPLAVGIRYSGGSNVYTECSKCGMKADAMAHEHIQFLEAASQDNWCPEEYTPESRARVRAHRDQYKKDAVAAFEAGTIPDGWTEDSLRPPSPTSPEQPQEH